MTLKLIGRSEIGGDVSTVRVGSNPPGDVWMELYGDVGGRLLFVQALRSVITLERV